MAEAFLNALGKDHFEAESAGLEPRSINPLVVEVMKEIGYDLTTQKADSIFHFFKEGRLYDFVIYVCDKETEAKCPIFPGICRTLSWPFPDPGKLEGTRKERLHETRKTRDEIKSRVQNWIKADSLN
jgi:arsenate reductase